MTTTKALHKIVEVEWIDACVLRGWKHPDEVRDLVPLPCVSVGYLARQTPRDLVLVQSQSDAGSQADSLVIPRSCVKEVRQMKSSKKSGKGKKC